jgi:hypothetical protein
MNQNIRNNNTNYIALQTICCYFFFFLLITVLHQTSVPNFRYLQFLNMVYCDNDYNDYLDNGAEKSGIGIDATHTHTLVMIHN